MLYRPTGSTLKQEVHFLGGFQINRGESKLNCRKSSGLVAFKRAKMVEAIAGRITIGFVCLLHALGHHLSCSVFVISAHFFFIFTIQTDRLVIDDR